MADNGWGALRLGDICTKIGSGATPRGGKEVYLRDGPCALIRSQNVHNDHFHHDGLAFIDIQQATDLDNVEVFADDVLLNITGDSVARACQVAPDVLPARVNQHVAIVRPDTDKLLPRYLRYFLVSPETQAMLLSWAGSGGTRNALTKGMIESFNVRAPMDIAEQRAIAHILGTLDDKIELNRRMNETLEAMARALFKDWFVDFGPTRAKIEGRDPYLAPEIWDLFPDKLDEDGKPEGWEVFRLNQIAKHHTEVLSPAATPDTEFEHFSLPAFDAGRRPAIDKGLSIKSNKTLVPKRAVLLSKLNPEIPRVWLPEDPSQRQQIGSTEFLALVPSVIAGRALLFCLFSDDRFREMLQSMVTGTSKSHQRISPKSLYEREVIAGNIQLFARFEELAHYLLVKTLANRSEAWTLAQARDLLLPKLMSGKIRVGDADKFVQEST